MNNTECTTAAPASASPYPTWSDIEHPAWCNDHDGFTDGSSDWHKSADVEVGEHVFYVSTGTVTGEAEVFVTDHPSEGISLREAEAFAFALLAAVKAATA